MGYQEDRREAISRALVHLLGGERFVNAWDEGRKAKLGRTKPLVEECVRRLAERRPREFTSTFAAEAAETLLIEVLERYDTFERDGAAALGTESFSAAVMRQGFVILRIGDWEDPDLTAYFQGMVEELGIYLGEVLRAGPNRDVLTAVVSAHREQIVEHNRTRSAVEREHDTTRSVILERLDSLERRVAYSGSDPEAAATDVFDLTKIQFTQPERAHPATIAHLENLRHEQEDEDPPSLFSLTEKARSAAMVQFYEYRPETFVERQRISDLWDSYLVSAKLTFALVGHSGNGKSSIVCNWSDRLAESKRPCLIYRAESIGDSVITRVLEAVLPNDARVRNLHAEDRDTAWQLLGQRIATESSLVVFIDALDGAGSNRVGLAADLDWIASHDPHGEILRLVVSCTKSGWPSWSRPSGRLTPLAVTVFGTPSDPTIRAKGIEVGEFEDHELPMALEKNGITDLPPQQWQDLCRKPQILRMVASLSPQEFAGLPERASLTRLIDDLLDEKFPNEPDRHEAVELLMTLGRRMLKLRSRAVPNSARGRNQWSVEQQRTLDQLVKFDLLHRGTQVLKFQSDVIWEHVLGRCVHDKLFAFGTPGEAVEHLKARICTNSMVDMPGILESALRYRAETDVQLAGGHPDILLECVRTLSEMDDRWSVVAVLAIEASGDTDPRYSDILANLCSSASFPIRENAARVLARYREWESKVADSWQGQETIALSYSHGHACKGEQCPRLWDLANHPHWRVRRAAGYALHRQWQDCRGHTGWLKELVEGDPARTWRKGHALLIALTGGPKTPSADQTPSDGEYIIKCATSSSSQLRWLAAYYMGQYPKDTFQKLSEVFNVQETDPWVLATFGQSLVRALHSEEDTEAAKQVRAHLDTLLERHAPEVGVRVARSAGRLGGERLATLLDTLVELRRYPGIVRAASYGRLTHDPRSDARLWVEKVAYLDVGRSSLTEAPAPHEVRHFVVARREATFIEDPYVRSFEVMRRLLVDAVTAMGGEGTRTDQFIRYVLSDDDEGLRWALVLSLTERPPFSAATIAATVEHLSRDPHMWVRREVASNLMTWVKQGILQAQQARRLLARMSEALAEDQVDVREEVMPFIEASSDALATWELQQTQDRTATPPAARPAGTKIDLIWSLTLVCPWDCGMCCVDAVHVGRSGNDAIIRSENLSKVERVPLLDDGRDVYEVATRFRQQHGLELTLEQKLDVIDHLTGYDTKIDISGGDPLIHRENLEVVRAAAAAFGRANVTMTATGSALARWQTEKLIAKLAPLIGELNFTYDSPARGAKGLRPARYAQINLKHARAFGEAGVLLRAECPLTLENCDAASLDGIYRDLTEAKIPRLLLMRLFPSGRGASVVDKTPTTEQYGAAIDRLRHLERTTDGGPELNLQCALRHLERRTDKSETSSGNPCDLVRESFGLLADGRLLASPWATDSQGRPMADEWVLGNLATTELSNILDTPKVRAYRARLDENFGHCKIFSYLHSRKASVSDRIFDTADPLYVPSAIN